MTPLVKMLPLLFALLFVISLPNVYAGTGKIYGFGPDDPRLLTLDPSTGDVSYIGNGLPGEVTAQQLSSIDSKGGIYYTIAYNSSNRHNHLLGISLSSGSLVSSALLPYDTSAFVGVGEACDYDENTGNVLVSGVDNIGGAHVILSVDPKTGHNTLITKINDIEDVLGGATGYNPSTKTLWIQYAMKKSGIDNYGIDVTTGELKYKIPDSLNMETLAYDKVTKEMWGVGLKVYNSSHYTRTLVNIDNDGKLTGVADIPNYYIIDASVSALNSDSRVLYVILQRIGKETLPFRIVGIDIPTGKVVSDPVLCKKSSSCPWSLSYDPL